MLIPLHKKLVGLFYYCRYFWSSIIAEDELILKPEKVRVIRMTGVGVTGTPTGINKDCRGYCRQEVHIDVPANSGPCENIKNA